MLEAYNIITLDALQQLIFHVLKFITCLTVGTFKSYHVYITFTFPLIPHTLCQIPKGRACYLMRNIRWLAFRCKTKQTWIQPSLHLNPLHHCSDRALSSSVLCLRQHLCLIDQ